MDGFYASDQLGPGKGIPAALSSRLLFSPNSIYSLTSAGKTEEIVVIRTPPVACPVCFSASTETRKIPAHNETYISW